MKEYYKNHLDNYKQEAQKNISYVIFDIKPSEQDERDVVKWIKEIKTDFEKAEDNVQFVNMNADNRFEDVFDKKESLSPQLGEWAFSAETNDIYGPYKEGLVYKLAKLNAVKMLPDSVKASHILIRVNNETNAEVASATIDSLREVIESRKATFEQIAKDNSEDTGSAISGGDLGWFKRGMMVKQFEHAAFRAKRGDLVKVQTQFGYHLIKVTSQSKKTKHVQLAVVDREIIPSSTTYKNIYATASRFAAEAQDLGGFNEIVKKEKKSPRIAMLNENDRKITGLGHSRSFIRAAFNDTELGDLIAGSDESPVFELDDKFVVGVVNSEKEEGTKDFDEVKASIEFTLIKEKKKELIVEEFNSAQGSTIEEKASNLGLSVESEEEFNIAYGSIKAIGFEPSVNGAASSLELNNVSNPISGRNGVYIIELTDIKNNGTKGNIDTEKTALFRNASNRASYQTYNILKENTEIIDKRSKFY